MSPAAALLNTAFDRRYDCDLTDLPPDGHRQFLVPADGGGHSLAVRIEPWSAEGWVGVFAGGGITGSAGLYSTPDPEVVCVVAEGEGWLVNVALPDRYQRVRCTPILHVVPVPERRLLVFGSHTELVAYSAEGVEWTSDRLAYSEFDLREVTDATITGATPRVPGGENTTFTVDLATGAHTGGPFSTADQ